MKETNSGLAPRLLDVNTAAAYLGVSPWTLRALMSHGEVRAVRFPSTRRPGEVARRLLFDKADLDAVIELWKAKL